MYLETSEGWNLEQSRSNYLHFLKRGEQIHQKQMPIKIQTQIHMQIYTDKPIPDIFQFWHTTALSGPAKVH